MPEILFWILSAVAVLAGLWAITRRQPLACALSLVVSFVALAGLYFLLKAPFPAVLQIILYAGAIMVLVVFVIMFLNLPVERLGQDEISKPGIFVALLLLLPLCILLLGIIWGAELPPAADVPAEFGTVSAVGTELFTRWLYPFEVLSLLLLVAMVGAVLLAKKRLE